MAKNLSNPTPNAKPANLPATVLQAAQAASTSQPAALRHAQTLQALLGQSATRQATNSAAMAALLPRAMDPEIWKELLAIQNAILQRLQQQQQGWLQGFAALAEEYDQLRRANTMSEHIEQQCNLAAQFSDLCKTQATAFLSLQENIEVDCGYWVAQKVGS